ncbi:reverse transcriptase N-terminal domain-containing protein [Candidatus Williamhamiltonella defendens]|uniref:reverse transcriptase N-terminal domain-containing protein n=1 Tax=Candidatus Williamhamiltonella defendens TaxID=138072 RepID=UPI0020C6E6E2|nr:reverse transcriptase N-terminal domain-containing protein [Candidatus Hamiltonella defensa]
MTNVINQNHEQLEWHAINWRVVTTMINNLRQRIYRASATGDLKKVRNLQKLMMKSRANHLLAIRKVTQINRGKHTAGVDNQFIDDHKGREHLYKLLSQTTSEKIYPVKRVYIAKKNRKKRPLGIPTILERCKQAIVKSALEPYWEAKFEPVSYGFRPGRSAHDAIQKIFCIARARGTRHWVLDADIKSAFDNIDHNFLIKTIGGFPERNMIKKWLQAGVLEHGNYIPSVAGTPQGGIISPLLANIALHGMETLLGIQYWKNGKPKQGQPYAV